jgi:hypothetical protein
MGYEISAGEEQLLYKDRTILDLEPKGVDAQLARVGSTRWSLEKN